MRGLIDFIINRRISVSILLLFITIFLGYGLSKLRLNADFTTYLRQDDPLVKQYQYIGKEYASKSLGFVLVESEDVFSAKSLEFIRKLTESYEELDGVAYVTSLTNVLDFKKTEWGLEVGRLIPRGTLPQETQELDELKRYVLSKDRYVKDLVSEDGKLTVIVIRLMQGVDEFAICNKIKEVTRQIAPQNENIYFGGLPFIMNHMILLIQSNFTFLEPIMLLLIVFLLFLGFRKAGGVFLPLTIVFLSITWALGLMGWFGMSVDMLSGIMPVILIAMASADGIHIMRRYYEKRQSGIMGTAAIKETFFELSKPIIITTVTTIIGFLSLVSSNFSVIRQFGLVTSLGVFLALVVTALLIPAVLAFSKSTKNIKRESGKKAGEFKFMEHWAGFVFSKKIFIFLLMGLIVIAAVIGIPKIKKSVDWTLCLRRGSKAHQAEILLRREFGGTVPVQIIVKGDLKDAHTMKAMRYLERYLEAVPSVGEIHSIATIISEMNDTMNDRYLVPESNEGVANLWFLIEDEDVVEQLVREDKKEALIQAKIDSWETDFISGAVDQIDKFIEKLSKRLIVVELKDVLPEAKKALLRFRQERITTNLFRTFSKRDIIIEKEKIETIVNDALFRENLREEGYAEVKQEVIDYLLSERSEVGNISKESAEAIAENLLKGVRKDREIGTDVILRVVTSILSNQPNFLNRKESNLDDLNELSKSLDVIIRENIAELRVESALEEIKKLVRPGSIRRRELLRDLKGDLWEINESFIALDKQRHQELLIDLDIPKIREVPLSFEHTGLAAVLNKMEEELIPTQIQSLFIAFAAVVIILALIFRSLLLGLLGVIPITMTLLVNFSIMGYFDIGLDSFTAMIASIAIGLGIDTDVHFISCLRREFSKHKDEFLALKETMKTTGVAIIINAIAVGVGFAVLLLAGGQHIRRFGGLASLTILLSAFFTLTVLPAIILLVKPKFMRKRGGNK